MKSGCDSTMAERAAGGSVEYEGSYELWLRRRDLEGFEDDVHGDVACR